MATPTTIPASAFKTVPGTTGTLVQLNPVMGLVAPDLTPFTGVIGNIQNTLTDTATAATGTALPAPATPNNISFTDQTVNVSNVEPSDLYHGTLLTDVKIQFIDGTPDNMLVTALSPSVFIKTGTGNDVLIGLSGHNVLDGDGGFNTFVAGSGPDTMITDASTASAAMLVHNMGSGDDAVLKGIDASNFTFSLQDVLGGLLIDAAHNPAALPVIGGTPLPSGEMFLEGFKTSDIGGKLSLGIGQSSDGKTSFLFAHGT
jgi:hypothetical protein